MLRRCSLPESCHNTLWIFFHLQKYPHLFTAWRYAQAQYVCCRPVSVRLSRGWISVTSHPCHGLPANFQLSTPFRSRLRVSHATDRRTDNGHQCITPLWGRGRGIKKTKNDSVFFRASVYLPYHSILIRHSVTPSVHSRAPEASLDWYGEILPCLPVPAPSLPLPLEVGPVIAARGSGGAL